MCIIPNYLSPLIPGSKIMRKRFFLSKKELKILLLVAICLCLYIILGTKINNLLQEYYNRTFDILLLYKIRLLVNFLTALLGRIILGHIRKKKFRGFIQLDVSASLVSFLLIFVGILDWKINTAPMFVYSRLYFILLFFLLLCTFRRSELVPTNVINKKNDN